MNQAIRCCRLGLYARVVISPRGFATYRLRGVGWSVGASSSAREGSQPSLREPPLNIPRCRHQPERVRNRNCRACHRWAATGRHQPERVRNVPGMPPTTVDGDVVISPRGFATWSRSPRPGRRRRSSSAREGSQHGHVGGHRLGQRFQSSSAREGLQQPGVARRAHQEQGRHQPERVRNTYTQLHLEWFHEAVISSRGFTTCSPSASPPRAAGPSSTERVHNAAAASTDTDTAGAVISP